VAEPIGKKSVVVEIDGNLARIWLDDGRINLLGRPMLEALHQAIVESSDADAVILSGRSKIFSAGLDLPEINSLEPKELLGFFELLHDVRRTLFALKRPLITAVAGSAVGAGASLLCCGDIRIGARDSGKVGFTEAKLGVPLPSSARVIASSVLTSPAGVKSLIFGTTHEKEEAQKLGYFHSLVKSTELLSTVNDAAIDAAKTSHSSSMIKLSLRQAALDEMDRDREQSHTVMVEAWKSEQAQLQIVKVVESMKPRKRR